MTDIQVHLSDQELLIRNFHLVFRDTVVAHQAGTGARGGPMTTTISITLFKQPKVPDSGSASFSTVTEPAV